MATFTQRKNGRWQAKVRHGKIKKSRTFDRHEDAVKWARDVETRIDRNIFEDLAEAENTTFSEALKTYEETVSKHKDGYSQEKSRIATWRNDGHFQVLYKNGQLPDKFKLADRPLSSLRKSDFVGWRDKRLEYVSPSTCAKDLAIVKHLFNIAVTEWEILPRNPLEGLRVELEDNCRDRRLEGDEEDKLIKQLTPVPGRGQTRSPVIIPLVKIAIATAARQSELLALKWSDVDLDAGVIRIKGKERKSRRKDGKEITRTKNKDRYRDIPLTEEAEAVLSGLKMKGNVTQIGSAKVFKISPSVLHNAFAAACARAEIKDLTWHDLRHEGTSRLAEHFALHELMKITGHQSSKMLARYYHPRARDMVKKLRGASKD